ncbi:MAG: hypothetical protein SPF89_02760 [Sphaerochaetaceae bacterium]|nr:hypothetical protein [Spirochaetales bacterium]MDY5499005.1 hypothetical protein [Sphaerochaetaceae bacterium]
MDAIVPQKRPPYSLKKENRPAKWMAGPLRADIEDGFGAGKERRITPMMQLGGSLTTGVPGNRIWKRNQSPMRRIEGVVKKTSISFDSFPHMRLCLPVLLLMRIRIHGKSVTNPAE